MEMTLTEPHTASLTEPLLSESDDAKALSTFIQAILDENSAQDVIEIDIQGKSSVADFMLVASGRSNRHVSALSEYVLRALKEQGFKSLGIEGKESGDWVLIDVGDVILHLFRPEVRLFYNLEKIWSVPLPQSLQDMQDPQDD